VIGGSAETQFAILLPTVGFSFSLFSPSITVSSVHSFHGKLTICSSNRIPIGTFRLNVPMGLWFEERRGPLTVIQNKSSLRDPVFQVGFNFTFLCKWSVLRASSSDVPSSIVVDHDGQCQWRVAASEHGERMSVLYSTFCQILSTASGLIDNTETSEQFSSTPHIDQSSRCNPLVGQGR